MKNNYKVWLRQNRFLPGLTGVFLMLLVLASATVYGQSGAYQFAQSTTTWTEITGTASTASGDDGTQSIALPIPFNYNFAPVTNVTFSTNGFLRLTGGSMFSSQWTNELNSTTKTPVVAGFWDDNNLGSGSISYTTEGTAPNRVFIAQWKEIVTSGSGSSSNVGRVSFQIKLYETTDKIEIVMGPSVAASTTLSASIGINNAPGGSGNYLSITPGAPATTSSTSANNSISAPPASGTVYEFLPPPPMSIAGTQVLSINNRGVGRNTVNNAMAVLNIATIGIPSPISVSDIQVNTGSTTLSNISNLKIFYTGSSTTFSTTTQFGSTIAAPAATNTVSATQTLGNGNNFFWITYDVAANATVGDSLYVRIPSVNAGTTLTVADSAAALPRGVMAPLAGSFNVGTGNTYTTLSALFTDMNTAGISGNITANITSNLTEPGAAALGSLNEVGGTGFTVTIRPSGGPRTISGAVPNSGVIVLNGADRVTIDGRIGGTGNGRDLTIINTSAATVQVGILLVSSSANPSQNNVLRNLVVKGSLNNTGTGTVVGIQAQGNGHENLLITNNHITTNNFGINVFASATPKDNVGVQITNNIIGSDDPMEYVTSRGILANVQGAEISGNKIYNFITTNSGAFPRGIETGDTTVNTNIFNNVIDNMEYVGTSFRAGQGIYLSTATAVGDANVKVYNNAISRLKGHGSSTATNNSWGIIVNLGIGYHIWNNSVSISDDRTSTSSTDFHGGILVNSSASANLDIRNNNLSILGRPGNTAGRMFGIRSSAAAAAFDTLDNNNLYVDTLNQGVTGFITSNRISLADWQLATGKEANSKAVFANFWNSDLLVPNSVALDNSGTPISGLTTDITGATRNATTPDIGAYEFSPVNTDVAALAITGPMPAGCFSATESGSVLVKNTGLQSIDFSTNALTVTLRMSGAGTDTATVVINTGNLNAGDTLLVNFPNAFDMTAFGMYTFEGNVAIAGDGIGLNNNFAPYMQNNVAPVSSPFSENFDNVNLSDLANNNWSFSPNWNLGASGHGVTGNGIYFNLYSSAAYTNPSFIMPKIGPVSATSNFNFAYRLVNWSGYPADSFAISGADSVVIEVSTDCGLNYTRLYKIDSTNHTPTTNWSSISVPMAAYAGQVVQVRVRGHWATGDYYLDMDNMGIASPSFPVSLIAPVSGTTLNVSGAGSTTINANWTRASADPVIYEWLLSDTSRNFAAPLATFLSNNNGADTVLTLNFYQIDDLMASLGIQVGQTALASWTVRINNGGSITYAQDTFNISLNRNGLAPVQFLAAPVGGTGTSQLRGPNGTSAHANHRGSMITLASEFAAIGIDSGSIITSMGFSMTIPPSSNVRGRMRVWLQPTDSTRYTKGTSWASILNGMVLVADDSVTISSSSTRWNVSFNNPIVYAGKSWNVAWEFNSAGPFATTAATYDCNTTLNPGLASGNSATTPPATLALTSFRTSLLWGVERRANDLDILATWALGKNPRIYGAPEKVLARVRNNGFNASTAAPVTLNVTGANTFTSAVNVSLTTDSVVTLEFPFTAANTGFNTISVSVGADDRNLNNNKSALQQVTDSVYSYADTVTTGLSAVGYNTGSGLLLTKYRVTGTRQVKAARIRIGNNPATVGNSVFAVVTNDTGAIIAQSAPATIVTADLDTWKIFTFTIAPTITDTSFLIGLAQPANTTTGYFPVGYQAETPTRPGAYFGANLGGGGLGEVSGFRLMIEAHVGAIAIPDTLSAFSLLTPANNDSINVNGAGSTALNFTWQPSTRSTSGAVTYTWTLETTNANPVALITRSGLTSPNVSIDYAALADTLSARGIAAGNTFNGRWRVVASSGTLTRTANANFNIKLRRGQITSVEESAFSQAISLYPNPANGVTSLEINGQFNTELEVVVVNAMGQEMIRKQMQPAMGALSLDLSALNQGMYFVRISNGQELAVKRLMIQR